MSAARKIPVRVVNDALLRYGRAQKAIVTYMLEGYHTATAEERAATLETLSIEMNAAKAALMAVKK